MRTSASSKSNREPSIQPPRQWFRIVAAAVTTMLGAGSAAAQTTYTWTGLVSDDWEVAGNWVPPGISGSDDTAIIANGTVQTGSEIEVVNVDHQGGTISGSGSLKVSGTYTWTGGTLDGGASEAGAAWSVAAGALLDFDGGNHAVALGGTGMTGEGAVRFNGGTAALTGDGPYDVAETHFLAGTASFGLASAARTATAAHGPGATLDGAGALEVTESYTWTGGTMDGGGEVVVLAGAALEIGGADAKSLRDHTLRNAGTATWSGGQINSGRGGLIENLEGATFRFEAAEVLGHNQGGVRAMFTNAGRVVIEPPEGGGNVSFQIDFRQTGGSTELENATFGVSQGIQLEGGVLVGTGTVDGDVNNTAGRFAPGAAGETTTFTITGDYTQGEGASMEVEVCALGEAPDHDRVVVQGDALLAGSLTATMPEGCTGQLGDLFPVFTAESLSGGFSNFTGGSAGEGLYLDWFIDGTTLFIEVVDPTPSYAVGAHRVGDGIAFTLRGVAGLTYAVESTTDLRDPESWTVVFTGVMPGTRLLEFADPDAHTADPERWYRGAHVP